MEQQTSAAHAFFLAHKDLFQYEKYVGSFQNEDEPDGRAGHSFLEQYRQVDRDRPPAPALSELRFSLLHSPESRLSIERFATNTTAPVPGFVTLQSTASILESLNNLQHEPSSSLSRANSLQRVSVYHQLPPRPLEIAYDCTPALYPKPDSVSASKPLVDSPDRYLHSLPQQLSPARLPVDSKKTRFSLPKLDDLLIDRETRSASSAHKSWDEAHKIEVLVGGKCVGRLSAASRNIPQSIRSRLRASANVSVRREQLYDLLRRDYEELSKRCTQ